LSLKRFKVGGASADPYNVNQHTFEELSFGIDLTHLALGLESHDPPYKRSREVEELEVAVQAVLSHAADE